MLSHLLLDSFVGSTPVECRKAYFMCSLLICHYTLSARKCIQNNSLYCLYFVKCGLQGIRIPYAQHLCRNPHSRLIRVPRILNAYCMCALTFATYKSCVQSLRTRCDPITHYKHTHFYVMRYIMRLSHEICKIYTGDYYVCSFSAWCKTRPTPSNKKSEVHMYRNMT